MNHSLEFRVGLVDLSLLTLVVGCVGTVSSPPTAQDDVVVELVPLAPHPSRSFDEVERHLHQDGRLTLVGLSDGTEVSRFASFTRDDALYILVTHDDDAVTLKYVEHGTAIVESVRDGQAFYGSSYSALDESGPDHEVLLSLFEWLGALAEQPDLLAGAELPDWAASFAVSDTSIEVPQSSGEIGATVQALELCPSPSGGTYCLLTCSTVIGLTVSALMGAPLAGSALVAYITRAGLAGLLGNVPFASTTMYRICMSQAWNPALYGLCTVMGNNATALFEGMSCATLCREIVPLTVPCPDQPEPSSPSGTSSGGGGGSSDGGGGGSGGSSGSLCFCPSGYICNAYGDCDPLPSEPPPAPPPSGCAYTGCPAGYVCNSEGDCEGTSSTIDYGSGGGELYDYCVSHTECFSSTCCDFSCSEIGCC